MARVSDPLLYRNCTLGGVSVSWRVGIKGVGSELKRPSIRLIFLLRIY